LFGWVIENLIKNSLQALNGQPGHIQLATARLEDRDQVTVRISDTGCGIQPNTHRKIFQTGYSTKKRGWGLGLSLARRIIEEYHRGKIELKESTPNVRTTFEITLAYAGEASGKDKQ
jgi:hypothetical protein